jgi:hypothetical protein
MDLALQVPWSEPTTQSLCRVRTQAEARSGWAASPSRGDHYIRQMLLVGARAVIR